MNIETAFPSKYLKAADLQGRSVRVTIRSVLMEAVGKNQDQKPILYFQGKDKGLCLNRTNSNTIAMIYGQETDNWIGGEVELFPTTVEFGGQMTEAIRVRIPPRKPSAPVQTRPAPPPPVDPDDNYRGEPLDDEIPFAPEWRG